MFGSQPHLKNSLRQPGGQAFSSTRMQTGIGPYEQASAFTQNQMGASFGSNFNPGSSSIKTMYNAAARAHSSLGISHGQTGSNFPIGANQGFNNQLRLSQNLNSDNFLPIPGMTNHHQPFQSSLGFQGQNYDTSQINEVFTTNPTLLLHQHNQCKVDNKERLKGVKNLEDLINFKVTTIADQIKDQKDQLFESQFKSQESELNGFNVVQMQSDNSINALKKMCDPLLSNGYYPKLLSKKEPGLGRNVEDKYQIPKSWMEPRTNYGQVKIPKQKNKLDKIEKKPSIDKDGVKKAGNEGNQKTNEDRPDSNESYQRNRQRFLSDQENLKLQSEKIKKEHDESIKDQEERINKQRADKQIDPVKLLKGFFENRASGAQQNHRAKTEMSQHESQTSFQQHPKSLKPSNSIHPNYVVAKYKKMKEAGKLEKMERQILERQSQVDLQLQYDQFMQLQNLSTYLAQKEAMENNIALSQAQIQEMEQLQGISPIINNLNPDSRHGSADILLNNQQNQAIGVVMKGVNLNASKYQNELQQQSTEENEDFQRKDNISKMRTELKQIFNEDEHEDQSPMKHQKSKPISEITPSVMSPTALLERVDKLIDPLSHKSRLNTQHTNGNTSQGQNNFPMPENKVGSGLSNYMSFQRSSLASVGIGIRESEPVIIAPRDAVTHERLVRVVKNHQTFAPKRQYGQKVGKLFGDLSQKEKSSVVRHSELTKYQSVKTSGTTKSYVSYTDEQIKLAQKLKSMEQNQQRNNQQKTLREGQQQQSQSSYRDQSQDIFEAEKRRQLKMLKFHEQHHASIGAISIDLRGSLPKIKHELEKKTEKSSIFGRKIYKEDEVEYSGLNTNEHEYSNITPVQISDYGMGPGSALATKQRTQNNFNTQAQKGMKSQQFQRNARVTFNNKKPQQLMDISDPNSPEVNGRNIYLIPRGYQEFPLEPIQVSGFRKGEDYDEVNLADADPQFRAAAVQAQSSSGRDYSIDKTETQEMTVNNSAGFVRVHGSGSVDKDTFHMQKGSFQEETDYAQTKPMIDMQKVDPFSSGKHNEEDQDTVKHMLDSNMTTPHQDKNIFGPDTNTAPTKVVSVLKSTDGVHESTIKMPQVEERSSERIETEIDALKGQDPYGLALIRNENSQNLSFTSKSEFSQPVKTPNQVISQNLVDVEQTHGTANKTQGFIQSSEHSPKRKQERVPIFSNQQSKPNLLGPRKESLKKSQDNGSVIISDVPIQEKEMTSDVIIRITKEPKIISGSNAEQTKDDKFSSKSIEDSKNQSLKNFAVIGEGQKLSEHPFSKQLIRDKGSKSSLRGQINKDIIRESADSNDVERVISKRKPSIPQLIIDSNLQSGIQSDVLTAANQAQPLKIKDMINAQFRRKKPTKDEYDKGYHSSNEPLMDQVSSELYDQIIQDHLVRRGCWIPQRFKKFPRFTIFTQKDGMDDKDHLINQYISLNPQVLALLAASDVTNIGQISTVLEEPAVTNRSGLIVRQENSKSPHRGVKLETVIGLTNQDSQIDNQVNNPGNQSNRTVKKEDTQVSPQLKGEQLKSRLTSSNHDKFESKTIKSHLRASSQEPLDIINDLMGQERASQNQLSKQNEQPQTTTTHFDPFDKVLLTKGIDNQILTSFRTLSKDNNMISNTLKVVHQRFFGSGVNKAHLSRLPRSKILYPLNREIYDPEDHQNTLDSMTEQQKRDYASYLVLLSQIGMVDDEGNKIQMMPENLNVQSGQMLTDGQKQVAIHGSDPLASMTSHASDLHQMRAQGFNREQTMKIIPSEHQNSYQSNTFRINSNRTPQPINDQTKVEPDFNKDDGQEEMVMDKQQTKVDPPVLNLKQSEKMPNQTLSKNSKVAKVHKQRSTLAMGKVNVNQGQEYNSGKTPYMVDGKSIKAIEKEDGLQNRTQKKVLVKGSLPQVQNITGRNVMQNSIIESRSGGGTRRGTSFSPDRRGHISSNLVYDNLPGETLEEPSQPINVIDSQFNTHKDSQSIKEVESKASVRISENNMIMGINTGGTTTQYGTLNEGYKKQLNANRQSNQDTQIKIVKINAPESVRHSRTFKKKDLVDATEADQTYKSRMQKTASIGSMDQHIMTLGTNNANISRQEENFYNSQKGKSFLPHMQVEVITNSSKEPSQVRDMQMTLAIQGKSHIISPSSRQEKKNPQDSVYTTQNIKQDQLRKTTNKFSGGFHKPKSKYGTQYTDKTVTPNNKSDKQKDMLIQETNTIDQDEREALLRKTDMVQVLSLLTQQAHGSSLEELQRILQQTQQSLVEEQKQLTLQKTQNSKQKEQTNQITQITQNNQEQTSQNQINKSISQGYSQTNYHQIPEKHHIKKMIDEIYAREKRYQKKQTDRDDLLQTNDMIFDLSKAHELNSMNLQQAKPTNSEERHVKHPYIWNRPPVFVQRGPPGVKHKLENNVKNHSVSPSQPHKEKPLPETLHNSPKHTVSQTSVPKAKDQNLQLIIEGQTPAENSDWVTPSQLKAITSALKSSERQAVSNNKNLKKLALGNQAAQSNRAEVAVGEQLNGGDYMDPATQRASLVSRDRDPDLPNRIQMVSGASNRLGTGHSTTEHKSPKNSQGEKFEEFVNGVQIHVNQKN